MDFLHRGIPGRCEREEDRKTRLFRFQSWTNSADLDPCRWRSRQEYFLGDRLQRHDRHDGAYGGGRLLKDLHLSPYWRLAERQDLRTNPGALRSACEVGILSINFANWLVWSGDSSEGDPRGTCGPTHLPHSSPRHPGHRDLPLSLALFPGVRRRPSGTGPLGLPGLGPVPNKSLTVIAQLSHSATPALDEGTVGWRSRQSLVRSPPSPTRLYAGGTYADRDAATSIQDEARAGLSRFETPIRRSLDDASASSSIAGLARLLARLPLSASHPAEPIYL